MDGSQALFPQNDFILIAGILALPLFGAFINGLFGKRLGKEAVTLMALTAVGGSFVGSLVTFLNLVDLQQAGGEGPARLYWKAWEWFSITQGAASGGGSIPIDVAFSVDALSGTMTLIITGIGFLIHLYSTKYMESDAGYHRFFTYLNLFVFSMLVLVLGDSLPVLFVGWEGVGLCSYLLIGFWYGDEKNASAGKKAFITNRIGDFGLLIGMGLLVYYVGALDWHSLAVQRQGLLVPVEWFHVGSVSLTASAATLTALALFLGCCGKSAQLPLHVWLPDAMAGPTPVSALIHAATMVTAGVYLLCRMAPVFVLSPAAMFTVALVGGVTAFIAATIALVQNDIKKVLAYSTVSQLGYMFLGAGVGAFTAGFFHVITHAFFKACLFLGAGSVIHAMHARIHDTDASQDMRNMGGLRRFLPVTFITFAVSWAAISGFPMTSGFFSKDAILEKAFTSRVKLPFEGGVLGSGDQATQLFEWPSWGPSVLYALGLSAAVMTAFYMSRLVIGTFLGDFRGWQIQPGWRAAHDDHGDGHDDHGHDDHGHDAHDESPRVGPTPHESPWQMTLPLVVLAIFALGAGFLNAHLLHLHAFDAWLEPVFELAGRSVEAIEENEGTEKFLAFALGAFGVGAGLAWWMYVAQRGEPAKQLSERLAPVHAFLRDKWRFDEFYEETVLGAVDLAGDIGVWADKWVVDGVIARASSLVIRISGSVLRMVQTGRTSTYGAVMVGGVLAIGWFLSTPHAVAVMNSDLGSGEFRLTAASGIGYQYRWDADGDGEWDQSEFGAEKSIAFSLPVDGARLVKLEVRNGLGRSDVQEFAVSRVRPDVSTLTTAELQAALHAAQQARPRPTPEPAAAHPGSPTPAGAQHNTKAAEK